jgi:hypothetical protein
MRRPWRLFSQLMTSGFFSSSAPRCSACFSVGGELNGGLKVIFFDLDLYHQDVFHQSIVALNVQMMIIIAMRALMFNDSDSICSKSTCVLVL